MSLYTYVGTPNPNLICCICRTPFTDPTTTRTCAHTFCSECILRALSHSSLCPVDRSPLALEDLGAAGPIVRSMVDELPVECVHRAEGCLHVCQRQDLATHLKEGCAFAEVRCELRGCEEVSVKRDGMKKHLLEAHGQEVDGREEGKDRKEGQKQDELEDETSDNTESETQPCPHAALGCPYTGTGPPTSHLASCPYEALKGFVSAHTARNALLTEQNILLRHRVDTLESAMQVMRREMGAVRAALGPWYKTAYHGVVLPRSAGTSSELPVGLQPASAGPSGVVGLGMGGAPELEHAQVVTGTSIAPDIFAPYFPMEESLQPRAPMGHRTSASLGGEGAYGRSASAAGVIAPLDLGTTLEGTLTGLRESVVGLAAGVDSVGRRSEIAIANETLRLQEELMSVRVQMNGLRMQVHGMMMDRNAALRGGEEGAVFGQQQQFPVYPAPRVNFGVPPSITKL
ncbi:unnamed protein product [Cyclocybe aegerita]|uniref:RING-type domain-containing protein n=1 Tax=Cyclocybe aegerita TaxID=1973307 RepID=A0A8S0W8U1_CYCAE|nr:unnamed protein product [Cyclocybe aegerita]